MKPSFSFIAGALLLAATAMAADKPAPFDPKRHRETTLPPGILYMDPGTIHFVNANRVVVDDADYPFHRDMQVFTADGLKTDRDALKEGQKVELYANDRHEAVYVVVK